MSEWRNVWMDEYVNEGMNDISLFIFSHDWFLPSDQKLKAVCRYWTIFFVYTVKNERINKQTNKQTNKEHPLKRHQYTYITTRIIIISIIITIKNWFFFEKKLTSPSCQINTNTNISVHIRTTSIKYQHHHHHHYHYLRLQVCHIS